MYLTTHIKEAFLNLIHAKMRSFLAILGILVGTGSVVALISSSQLATQHALAEFKSLGTNLLSMSLYSSYNPEQTSQAKNEVFTENDIPLITKEAPQVVLSAPYVALYKQLNFYGKSYNSQILGITKELAEIVKIEVDKGRLISYLDKNSYYCNVGSSLASSIKASMGIDPLYKQMLVGNTYFTIIGILKPWKPSLFFSSDINNGVIIPLQTSYLISSQAAIQNVLFRLIKDPDIQLTQSNIKKRISLLLPSIQVDFQNPQQIMDIVGKERKTFTWLLGAIGGISLLVGGIGVMNIMLVSVIERRREIGIRMAIGAQQGDILLMFLIEAIILTVFGGIIGIFFGVVISFGIAKFSEWGFQLFWMPIFLGFFVSVLVGILSGFYPALRASKLDPIQSLGSE